MKSGKATVPNDISFGDYGIDKISTLLNEFYDTGQIPPHISKSIFKALPKKPGQQSLNYTEQ